MQRPTRIEQLDRQFPGLADQVRAWFNHGISSEKVAARLWERYQVRIPAATVGSFRARRWAREMRIRLAGRIKAEATADFQRYLKLRKPVNGSGSRMSA